MKLPNKPGIYTITNLVTGKIYVGYTKNFRHRKNSHFGELKRKEHKNEYLQNSYNKHGIFNFVFEILEECSEEYFCSLEHYWCNMLNTHNRKYGYNNKPTHPHKKHASQSKETLLKIRNANLGRKASEEQKQKMRISSIDKNIIPIVQFDKDLNFVREWRSITECSKHLNISTGAISDILHKNHSHSKGHCFIYKTEYEKGNLPNKPCFDRNRREILQFDLEGNLINSFNSVREASKLLDICDSYLGQICKDKKIYKNFIWKYKED